MSNHSTEIELKHWEAPLTSIWWLDHLLAKCLMPSVAFTLSYHYHPILWLKRHKCIRNERGYVVGRKRVIVRGHLPIYDKIAAGYKLYILNKHIYHLLYLFILITSYCLGRSCFHMSRIASKWNHQLEIILVNYIHMYEIFTHCRCNMMFIYCFLVNPITLPIISHA